MAVKAPDVRTSLSWLSHYAPVWCLVTIASEFVVTAAPSVFELVALNLWVHMVTVLSLVAYHPLSCRWCRALEAQRSAGAHRHRTGLWLLHHRRWLYVPIGWGAGMYVWLFVAWHPGPGLVMALATLVGYSGLAAYRYAGTVHTAFRYWCLDCPPQDT